MVRAAGGVEARVGPVAEVAVLPDGHAAGGAGAGFEGVGAGEGFEEELRALGCGGGDVAGVGGDDVVALFVVVVAEELGLGIAGGLVRWCHLGKSVRFFGSRWIDAVHAYDFCELALL